jgi:MFS family permease
MMDITPQAYPIRGGIVKMLLCARRAIVMLPKHCCPNLLCAGWKHMATTPIDTLPKTGTALPPRSRWGLIQLTFFWIAANFHWAALPIIILPSQVQVILWQHYRGHLSGAALDAVIKSAWPGALALVVGPGLLVALIANPLFGWLSDRTRLRWGRRKPYILIGTLVNVIGLGGMAVAPNLPILIATLMFVQIANNAASAPFHALLPDLVPPAQRGIASGYMGLGQMLGTILGATLPGLIFGINAQSVLDGTTTLAHYQRTLWLAYGFTAAFITALALITVLAVQERPLAERVTPPTTVASDRRFWRACALTLLSIAASVGITAGVLALVHTNPDDVTIQNVLILPALVIGAIGVAKTFDFRPRQHRDFAWVLLTRAIVMMGLYTVLSFLQLYLKYVTFQHVPHAPRPEDAAAIFVDIVIVLAALSTVFAGALSDRLGRKRMVYLSGALMALVGLVFLATPVLPPSVSVPITLGCAAIFGLGFGAYASVDWALGADVLPDPATYARDMGIWNVALTAPQVLAYVVGAFVIAAFNGGGIFAIAGQPNLGYMLLFVLLVIYAVIGTAAVRNITGVR